MQPCPHPLPMAAPATAPPTSGLSTISIHLQHQEEASIPTRHYCQIVWIITWTSPSRPRMIYLLRGTIPRCLSQLLLMDRPQQLEIRVKAVLKLEVDLLLGCQLIQGLGAHIQYRWELLPNHRNYLQLISVQQCQHQVGILDLTPLGAAVPETATPALTCSSTIITIDVLLPDLTRWKALGPWPILILRDQAHHPHHRQQPCLRFQVTIILSWKVAW